MAQISRRHLLIFRVQLQPRWRPCEQRHSHFGARFRVGRFTVSEWPCNGLDVRFSTQKNARNQKAATNTDESTPGL